MPTLNWLTREEDLKISVQAPNRLLEAVPGEAVRSFGGSGNKLSVFIYL